ncbi:hypothetical protein [Salinisphaera sp. T31B1]|uniref:hypothetical protein n=1 Tax=Salinisphaera sp. T31B1 TaxID=727963 RepID=UPI00334068BA
MTTKTAASTRTGGATPSERTPANTKLYRTKNDLPPATRAQVADLLNQRLADCIDLQTQCKQAHWNLKGSTHETEKIVR